MAGRPARRRGRRPPAPSRFVGVVTARRRRENPLARAMLDALRETTSVARLARPATSSA